MCAARPDRRRGWPHSWPPPRASRGPRAPPCSAKTARWLIPLDRLRSGTRLPWGSNPGATAIRASARSRWHHCKRNTRMSPAVRASLVRSLHAAVATCSLARRRILSRRPEEASAWALIMLMSTVQPSSSIKASVLHPAAPIRRPARTRLGFAQSPLLAPRLSSMEAERSSLLQPQAGAPFFI